MQHLEPRRPKCHALPPQLDRPTCPPVAQAELHSPDTKAACAGPVGGCSARAGSGKQAGAERACLQRRRLLKAYPNDWQVWLAREGSQPECIATQVRAPGCWCASATFTALRMWGRQTARARSSTVALRHCHRSVIAGFHVMHVRPLAPIAKRSLLAYVDANVAS